VDISRGKYVPNDIRAESGLRSLNNSTMNVSTSMRTLKTNKSISEIDHQGQQRMPHHWIVRKEQKRLIDIENVKIANKLMTVRGSKELKVECLEKNFQKQMKAKAVLCKLPIIDMAQNRFRYGAGADQRGLRLSSRDHRRIMRNDQSQNSLDLSRSQSHRSRRLFNKSSRHIMAHVHSFDSGQERSSHRQKRQ
jgi:hypothetical protein